MADRQAPQDGRAVRALRWFFENRRTGAITVAQAPNLLLWIAIASGLLRAILEAASRPAGHWDLALTIVFRGSLLLWALDELVRGVNPWRRCLGAGVIALGVSALYH